MKTHTKRCYLYKSPKNYKYLLKKESTCSIRLRTAKAGLGKPWAEVALCTPPEMGVLKSPALVPPLLECSRSVTTFEAWFRSFLFVSCLSELSFRIWESPSQQSWSSHLALRVMDYYVKGKNKIRDSSQLLNFNFWCVTNYSGLLFWIEKTIHSVEITFHHTTLTVNTRVFH